jgi:hypothetical protein
MSRSLARPVPLGCDVMRQHSSIQEPVRPRAALRIGSSSLRHLGSDSLQSVLRSLLDKERCPTATCLSGRLIRVVENEWDGVIVCPTSYSVAGEPINGSNTLSECHARLRRVQRAWFRGRGKGASRPTVHSFFILITEAAGGPLGATERCRATPSGVDEMHHWIGGPGTAVRPRHAIADLPAHKRSSGPPAVSTSVRLGRKMACDASSDDATVFSVAPRGPRSASVSKNPWPDTHSGTKWRDTGQRYDGHVQRPEFSMSKNPRPDTHSGTKWRDTGRQYNGLQLIVAPLANRWPTHQCQRQGH